MSDINTELADRLRNEVLVLDGAMGTMIQRWNLEEKDFRGDLILPSDRIVRGANDLLSLSRPDIIRGIHSSYIEAGADIIETNSFNANAISLAEYGAEGLVEEINIAAAGLAREVADRAPRRVYVAGSMGPSNVALSLTASESSKIDFDYMAQSYKSQALSLIRGGVDILLLETIFDTLNAKAAIAGVLEAFELSGIRLPLMLSVTLTETGRTLSGQSIEAFLNSIRHACPLSVGLNCGFGAEGMAPGLEKLQSSPWFVSMHPNAGLPDEMGQYTESPAAMAAVIKEYMEKGWINIVGGCCGTTPEHIREIARIVKESSVSAIRRPAIDEGTTLHLSGLLPVNLSQGDDFLKIGERCNVAGSRKFLKLINGKNYGEALGIAVGQIEKGARALDVNMDDAMLDAPEEMEKFVELLGADSVTSAAPLMIDSSDMEVIRRALKRIQGHPIVNSISLKEGEEKFLVHAREIRRLGASAVVMAFDEKGQAVDLARRKEICSRAYQLLVADGWRGEDIIFDPNILTIATGMPEHDRYALDFLESVEWIKGNLPGAKVSGGVSNLSFSFRGINKLREAMHTVFLHHASLRGMDMAIVNPSTSLDINSVDPGLKEKIEDVIFCRREDAVDRLLGEAAAMREIQEKEKAAKLAVRDSHSGKIAGESSPLSSSPTPSTTLEALIEKGIDTGLSVIIDKALADEGSAMDVVKNRLMAAMQKVGDDFGAGRIFLPQVVRSASVMKKAIGILTPVIERETLVRNLSESHSDDRNKKFVLATVKGDVHDIGKNIVAVILKCSGFDVIDLGVMVETDKIISTLKETRAGFLGLSGLITPSLSEMMEVAERLESEGMTDVVLCVGGATTSDLHTAVRLAPLFSGLTLHTRDAASLPGWVCRLADEKEAPEAKSEIQKVQENLRTEYNERKKMEGARTVTPEEKDIPRNQAFNKAGSSVKAPRVKGVTDLDIKVGDLLPLINWKELLQAWQISPRQSRDRGAEESERLKSDSAGMLRTMIEKDAILKGRVALLPANSKDDDIIIHGEEDIIIPTLRSRALPYMSVADFIAAENDWIGLFVATAAPIIEADYITEWTTGEYTSLLFQSLCDRLVEAATEYLHDFTHRELWQLAGPRGIRPAIGYPSLPDQSLVFIADKILKYDELGISLTSNGALSPSATTTGLILGNPGSRYFDIRDLTEKDLEDYSRRRGLPEERIRQLLAL